MLTSMSRLPLNTLPTFRAVARLANLRAAAEELHLTHSAISQQIRLLEEQLGFALFDRSGRRVSLNAAGAALLPAVEAALDRLDEGLRTAAATASGDAQRVRLTLLPSFAQRWLLPRIGRWREQHPCIALELDASQAVVDLQREGFHAALRQGAGTWRGLQAERLIDSPRVALAAPEVARRVGSLSMQALAREPLLGDADQWQQWFAAHGLTTRVNPVASFNDAGLMLQASEQGLGLALARDLLAADALRDGRLVRLSPHTLPGEGFDTFWLAYPPQLANWPPLLALKTWLRDELELSARELAQLQAQPTAGIGLGPGLITGSEPGPQPATTAGTAPEDPTESRSPAPSARRARSRAR